MKLCYNENIFNCLETSCLNLECLKTLQEFKSADNLSFSDMKLIDDMTKSFNNNVHSFINSMKENSATNENIKEITQFYQGKNYNLKEISSIPFIEYKSMVDTSEKIKTYNIDAAIKDCDETIALHKKIVDCLAQEYDLKYNIKIGKQTLLEIEKNGYYRILSFIATDDFETILNFIKGDINSGGSAYKCHL